MKNYAIRRLYSCFEVESADIENGSFDQKLEALDKELKILLEKYGLKYIEQDTRFIPQQKLSACKCDNCANLMINRDKNPTRFDGADLWADLETGHNVIVCDGGTYEGKSLCMECLPVEHRWGYFS